MSCQLFFRTFLKFFKFFLLFFFFSKKIDRSSVFSPDSPVTTPKTIPETTCTPKTAPKSANQPHISLFPATFLTTSPDLWYNSYIIQSRICAYTHVRARAYYNKNRNRRKHKWKRYEFYLRYFPRFALRRFCPSARLRGGATRQSARRAHFAFSRWCCCASKVRRTPNARPAPCPNRSNQKTNKKKQKKTNRADRNNSAKIKKRKKLFKIF